MKVVIFLILGGMVFVLTASVFYYSLLPPKISGDLQTGVFEVVLDIPPGVGIDEIASRLEGGRLIRSRQIFKIYSLLIGKAHSLKPGRYSIALGAPLPELVNILWTGPKDVEITIVPGMTLREVDDKLRALGVINSGELATLDLDDFKMSYSWMTRVTPKALTNSLNASIISNKGGIGLEGFLLPDTYFISPGRDGGAIPRKFLDNFEAKVLPHFPADTDLFNVLILASILEKEAPDYSDREIIAGILLKRLKIGMPLQVDSAIVYAKCGERFLGCPPLAEADYKIDSPYNAYLYPDLPPGPIANPGVEAIRAALNPQKSEYWYYLSDPRTRKTIFSKTLDEHNKNRVKYLLVR